MMKGEMFGIEVLESMTTQQLQQLERELEAVGRYDDAMTIWAYMNDCLVDFRMKEVGDE